MIARRIPLATKALPSAIEIANARVGYIGSSSCPNDQQTPYPSVRWPPARARVAAPQRRSPSCNDASPSSRRALALEARRSVLQEGRRAEGFGVRIAVRAFG